jgi:hypothetical protein
VAEPLEISDVIVEYDPATLARVPVREPALARLGWSKREASLASGEVPRS